MEKNETPKNLALLTADEVTLSILEVDADGVRIKLWPDVNAVRAHLEECCERMPGGRATVYGTTFVGGICTAPWPWPTSQRTPPAPPPTA